jgi:hypothetical protein
MYEEFAAAVFMVLNSEEGDKTFLQKTLNLFINLHIAAQQTTIFIRILLLFLLLLLLFFFFLTD